MFRFHYRAFLHDRSPVPQIALGTKILEENYEVSRVPVPEELEALALPRAVLDIPLQLYASNLCARRDYRRHCD
jgi:hypothetical protein